MKHIYILIFFCLPYLCQGQCPPVDTTTGFGQSSKVCPGQPVTFTNPHPGATRYEWEFCDELSLERTTALSTTIHSPSNPEIIEDNGQFYLFLCGSKFDEIYRFSYGTSLENEPKIERLNVSGFDWSETIKLVKDNGKWYGFVSNSSAFSSTNVQTFVRLDFGNSLDNEPVPTIVADFKDYDTCRSFDFIQQGGKKYAIVGSFALDKLIVLDFGNAYTNTPVKVNEVSLPGSSPIIVKSYQDCSTSLVYVIGLDNELYKINFNGNYTATPIINSLNSVLSINQPTAISFLKNDHEAAVVDVAGKIFFANVGITSAPLIKKEVAKNDFQLGISSLYDQGKQYLFSFIYNQRTYKMQVFNKQCDLNIVNSSQENPPPITFGSLGDKKIKLKVYDADDNPIKIYKSTLEVDKTSIISKFDAPMQCGFDRVFNNVSKGDFANVQSWAWDFGDGHTSTQEAPTHTYASTGSYDVSLTVQSNSGCVTKVQKSIVIDNGTSLEAKFEIPNEVCVGETFVPKNLSSFGSLGPHAEYGYYWDYGDGSYSPYKQASKKYNAIGKYDIKLTIQNKAGCDQEIIKQINVIDAPLADFEIPSSACMTTDITPINRTSGSPNGYKWNVEGIGSFEDENPTFSFPKAGVYSISLTANSTKCNNTIIKTINVLPKAKVIFAVKSDPSDPVTIHFDNQTVGGDSFEWDFGDGNTSTEKSPTHRYVSEKYYTVTLNAINADHCREVFTKTIYSGAQKTDIKIVDGSVQDKQLSIVLSNHGKLIPDSIQVFVPAANHQESHAIDIAPNQTQGIELFYQLSEDDYQNGYICLTTNFDQNPFCINLLQQFSVNDPYPNPSTSQTTFEYIGLEEGLVTLNIYNDIGEYVRTQKVPMIKGLNAFTMDTSFLPKGLYLFRFEYKGDIVLKKLVID